MPTTLSDVPHLIEDGTHAAYERDPRIDGRACHFGDGGGARGGIDRNDIGEGATGVDPDPVSCQAGGLRHARVNSKMGKNQRKS